MKLELKHLAPYLPYDLECEILDYKCDYVGEKYITLKGYYLIGDSPYFNFHSGKDYAGKNTNNFKPILRPLSDLGGKRTGGEVRDELKCSLKSVHEIWDLKNSDKTLNEISYETYIAMCENHVDFFGLINKGLAIDKNTLNNEK